MQPSHWSTDSEASSYWSGYHLYPVSRTVLTKIRTQFRNVRPGGTRHGRVVAAGPYLPDTADLAQLRYSAGFTEGGGRLALLVLATKVVTALLLLLLLPLVIVFKCLSRTQ